MAVVTVAQVKSRDREFDSIPHLVQHFSDNGLSLIINGHDVYLSTPVPAATH